MVSCLGGWGKTCWAKGRARRPAGGEIQKAKVFPPCHPPGGRALEGPCSYGAIRM